MKRKKISGWKKIDASKKEQEQKNAATAEIIPEPFFLSRKKQLLQDFPGGNVQTVAGSSG